MKKHEKWNFVNFPKKKCDFFRNNGVPYEIEFFNESRFQNFMLFLYEFYIFL